MSDPLMLGLYNPAWWGIPGHFEFLWLIEMGCHLVAWWRETDCWLCTSTKLLLLYSQNGQVRSIQYVGLCDYLRTDTNHIWPNVSSMIQHMRAHDIVEYHTSSEIWTQPQTTTTQWPVTLPFLQSPPHKFSAKWTTMTHRFDKVWRMEVSGRL